MQKVLDQLGLSAINDGTWFGATASRDESTPIIESFNPATNELIASVRSTSAAEYEQVVAKAQESFKAWRQIPAPVRGEAIRRIGNALQQIQRPARQPRCHGDGQDQG